MLKQNKYLCPILKKMIVILTHKFCSYKSINLHIFLCVSLKHKLYFTTIFTYQIEISDYQFKILTINSNQYNRLSLKLQNTESFIVYVPKLTWVVKNMFVLYKCLSCTLNTYKFHSPVWVLEHTFGRKCQHGGHSKMSVCTLDTYDTVNCGEETQLKFKL